MEKEVPEFNRFEYPCSGDESYGYGLHEPCRVELKIDKTRKRRSGVCPKCGITLFSVLDGFGYRK